MVTVSGNLIAALLVTGVFAGLAYALGMVSWGGALGGFAMGAVIYACLGPQGFAVLALFVVVGSALTRLGYRSKEQRRIAQSRGGRRGARNALANCSVALLCALLAVSFSSEIFAAAFVASLGAAFADLRILGGTDRPSHPTPITPLRKVPPGTAARTNRGRSPANRRRVTAFRLWLGLWRTGVALCRGRGIYWHRGGQRPRVACAASRQRVTNVLCTLALLPGLTLEMDRLHTRGVPTVFLKSDPVLYVGMRL